MNPRVQAVEAREDYILFITFKNGEKKLFNAQPYLDKGIFRELRNPAYFKSVFVQYDSVCWPHEQDFCPDTLYEEGVPVEE